MEQKKMISNEVLIYTGGLQIHHIGSWCQGRHYIWLFCICTRLRIRIGDEQACLHLSLSSQKRNVAWAERSMGNDEDIENASRYIFSLVSVELGLCSEVCTWVAKYSGPEHTPCVSACLALFGDKSELAAMNTDSLLMCYNLFWFAALNCPCLGLKPMPTMTMMSSKNGDGEGGGMVNWSGHGQCNPLGNKSVHTGEQMCWHRSTKVLT